MIPSFFLVFARGWFLGRFLFSLSSLVMSSLGEKRTLLEGSEAQQTKKNKTLALTTF
jgi:hypothetical protein